MAMVYGRDYSKTTMIILSYSFTFLHLFLPFFIFIYFCLYQTFSTVEELDLLNKLNNNATPCYLDTEIEFLTVFSCLHNYQLHLTLSLN